MTPEGAQRTARGRRRPWALLAGAGLAIVTACATTRGDVPAAGGEAWPIHEAIRSAPTPYAGIRTSSRYLAMRDGVRIAIDVHLPEGLPAGERVPTILRQTRYHRSSIFRWPFGVALEGPGELARFFVTRGYAWVDVDARGSGASFGSRPYDWSPDERRDGAEIVDWIVGQPWSNGRVGATGASYDGTAAEMLLVNRHPAVRAVAPRFSLFDVYTDIAFPGGVHLTWFTATWSQLNRSLDANVVPEDLPRLAGVALRGVRPVDEDTDGALLRAAIREHEANYDPHAWAQKITYRDDVPPGAPGTADLFSPHAFARAIDASGAAVFGMSGWFDGAYQHAAIKRHLTLENPANRLVIGPWDHGARRQISPAAASPTVRFDQAAELLRFFDHHLRGIDTGLTGEKPVHYYTMGEERWKAADRWPPRAEPRAFYLAPLRTLAPVARPGLGAADRYPVEPLAATGMTTRWRSLIRGIGGEPYPDRKERDAALLAYQTPPLAADLEVTGHPVARLFLSSTVEDGAVFVYLEDVEPGGRVRHVTEGVLRLLHRKLGDGPPLYRSPAPYRSFARQDGAPLPPGEVAEIVLDLLPTSYLFRRGHAIRIAIAGADRDYFAPVPADGRAPVLTLYRDATRPSRIELPVVPSSP